MGGYGSGRKATRALESTLRRLSADDLRRQGALEEHRFSSWSWRKGDHVTARASAWCCDALLKLDYHVKNIGGAWTRSAIEIRVCWRTCYLGGRRAYLLCPGPQCGRRALILYGDRDFLCRHCRPVAYASQRFAPRDRALARAQQLRLALGCSVDLCTPVTKPKACTNGLSSRKHFESSPPNARQLTKFSGYSVQVPTDLRRQLPSSSRSQQNLHRLAAVTTGMW